MKAKERRRIVCILEYKFQTPFASILRSEEKHEIYVREKCADDKQQVHSLFLGPLLFTGKIQNQQKEKRDCYHISNARKIHLYLHLLFCVRCVEDFGREHSLIDAPNAIRLVVGRSIAIPDFNNVEGSARTRACANDFRANCHTQNHVAGIHCGQIKHGGEHILLVNVKTVFLTASDTVAASANVMIVLPEGRIRVAHPEEHASLALITELLEDAEHFLESRNGSKLLKGFQSPPLFFV